MTNEEKQPLLKDLYARLPYGVKVQIKSTYTDNKYITVFNSDLTYLIGVRSVKPYLRPMSSMTEEEDKEWQIYKSRIVDSCDELLEERVAELHDWFNRHQFDYRGLIVRGLALEAPEGMYKTE